MKKAFTLIEILVVVTIIGMLLSIAVATYSSLLKSSRDAKRKTDLEQIRSALEMYRSNNDSYNSGATLLSADCPNAVFNYLKTPVKYIESLPNDPKSSSNYYYRCTVSADGSSYTLGAYLESGGSATASCSECNTVTHAACNYCVGPYGAQP